VIPQDSGLRAASALWLGADQWLEAMPTPAWLVDAQHQQVVYMNEPARRWLGLSLPLPRAMRAEALLSTLEDQVFWADVRAGHEGSLATQTEVMRGHHAGMRPDPDHPPRADGGPAPVQVFRRIVPMGRPAVAYLVTLEDRTQQSAYEQEREILVAELRATLEATADGILVTDIHGQIRAFNRRFARLWELPRQALEDPRDRAVVDWLRQSVIDPAAFDRRFEEVSQQMLLECTDTVALLNGKLLEWHTQPQWSRGSPIGRVFSFREVVSRRGSGSLREPLRLTPSLDPRTGWPHRQSFMEALDDAVVQARDEEDPMALLVVEFDRRALFAIDGTARVQAMSELTESLWACLREPGFIGRLGATRFAVLLSQSGESGAERMAERLVRLAREPGRSLLAGAGLRVHVGGAVYPQGGWCAEELMQHAEQALLRASGQPGSAWTLYRGLHSEPREGLRQQRLERAVSEGPSAKDFRLQFQPRFDAFTGAVDAVEALLRWHDPQEGLLLPPRFLPLAERAGLMRKLDDWVMEQSLRQAVAWAAKGWQQILTVNVSAFSLCEPAYARRVAALLQATGWAARDLELDVTELALQRDAEAALANLHALHRIGVRLVLDDWGVNDCALGWLRKAPFAALKLDRRLLCAVHTEQADADLARGLVQIARSFHLPVYGEGIEHETQRRFVVDELGCVAWQGVLGAAPMDARACARSVLSRGTLLQGWSVPQTRLSANG
jgi:EAL domain-containing protein (putative c-di-GMP-specific phosphodiesterase class I)/GGDEF domain-containing protein